MADDGKPALLTRAEEDAIGKAYNDLVSWVDQHQDAINNLLDSGTRSLLMGAVALMDPEYQWAQRYDQRRAASRARSLANLARGRALRAQKTSPQA